VKKFHLSLKTRHEDIAMELVRNVQQNRCLLNENRRLDAQLEYSQSEWKKSEKLVLAQEKALSQFRMQVAQYTQDKIKLGSQLEKVKDQAEKNSELAKKLANSDALVCELRGKLNKKSDELSRLTRENNELLKKQNNVSRLQCNSSPAPSYLSSDSALDIAFTRVSKLCRLERESPELGGGESKMKMQVLSFKKLQKKLHTM